MFGKRSHPLSATSCWLQLTLLVAATAGAYTALWVLCGSSDSESWRFTRPMVLVMVLATLFSGILTLGFTAAAGMALRADASRPARLSFDAKVCLALLGVLAFVTALEAGGILGHVVPAVAVAPLAGGLCAGAITVAIWMLASRRTDRGWHWPGLTPAHGLLGSACLLSTAWLVAMARGWWPGLVSPLFLVAGFGLYAVGQSTRLVRAREAVEPAATAVGETKVSQRQGVVLGAVLLFLACAGFVLTPASLAWRMSCVRHSMEFLDAIENARIAKLEELLDEHPGAIGAFELLGNSLLSTAALHSRPEAARLLLQRGADPNAEEILGMRPLHFAAVAGANEVAALLLANGADPNVEDGFGGTPLFHAAEGNHEKCADLLLAHGARHDVFSAAATGDLAALFHVIHVADLDARTVRGRTPLHVAAAAGHAPAVNALLEAGAGTEARDGAGRTPLLLAVANGHTDSAAALLSKRADPDAADEDGMTALHAAAQDGDADMARLLLDCGANPDPRAADGTTPMILAVLDNHEEVIDVLCGHGVREVHIIGTGR
jgi:ankyrin repeat protein